MRHVAEEVKVSMALIADSSWLKEEDRVLLEENLGCLTGRLAVLGGTLGQQLDHMRTRANELTGYKVSLQFVK